jgi:CheY-like chemotaxis protein
MHYDQIHSSENDNTAKLILAVEDDPGISELLVSWLTQVTSYRVLLVADGFKALELVKRYKPHLFLLNYYLPGMDGLELYDQLHAQKGLEDIPAIMLSAKLPIREIQQRNIACMSKPYKLAELLHLIEKLIA